MAAPPNCVVHYPVRSLRKCNSSSKAYQLKHYNCTISVGCTSSHSSFCTYLNGMRIVRSSTDNSRPYQGHIIKIWEEYDIKAMRDIVKPTQIRPTSLPVMKNVRGYGSGSGFRFRRKLVARLTNKHLIAAPHVGNAIHDCLHISDFTITYQYDKPTSYRIISHDWLKFA